ncbi:unnamed protein product [Microthlaspi erraticum]|uniref:Uncharacterized protein n=1 Tax=Microthlaspi erraticum TaxID=1685480 RepID=A0A6D2JEP9_9BRAS|nr:unnamed protein product [Microthlaspi erraticum]
MSSRQAPPPSWDSPPKLSSLKTKYAVLLHHYYSSHQTSSPTSSLPKAAQENHQTTLKVTMRQAPKDFVSGRALTPSLTKISYQSS